MGGACMPSGGVITIVKTGHFHMKNYYPEHPNARFDIVDIVGNLFQQYWTDYLGGLIYRRDHTDHDNAKQHPNVPHDHDMGKYGPKAPQMPVDKTGRFC